MIWPTQSGSGKNNRGTWSTGVLAWLLCALTISGCGGGGGGSVAIPTTMTLQASSNSPSEVSLTWNADSHAGLIGYDLNRDGLAASPTHLSSTGFADTGLTANTRYCYQVFAITFLLGSVGQSNPACITTPGYASGWTIGNVTNGSFASLAVAGTTRHIAWRQADGVHHASNSGGGWNASLVDGSAGTTGQTAVSVDGTGTIHVVYGDATSSGVRHASKNGAVWTIETINATGGIAVDLLSDSGGTLHVAYSDLPAVGNQTLWYANNAGGVWTRTQIANLGALQTIAIGRESGGAIQVGTAGLVGPLQCAIDHVRYSTGTAVTTPVDTGTSCVAAMDLDATGAAHIGYRKGQNIRRARVAGGVAVIDVVEAQSWIGADAVGLAVDATGQVRLAFGDRNNDLRHATLGPTGWSVAAIDRMLATVVLRIAADGRSNILYDSGSSGALRLAIAP